MKARRNLFLWGGVAVLLLMQAFPVLADAKGDAILRQAFKKLHAAKTYTANITSTRSNPRGGAPLTYKGTLAAMKPNFLRLELQGPNAPLYVADGKNYFAYGSGAPVYFKNALAPKPTEMSGEWEGEIDAFFGGEANADKVQAAYAGSEKVGGVECDLVNAEMKTPDRTVTYAIGKKDHLIRRAVLTFPSQNGQTFTQTNLLTNIRLNVSMTAARFAFKPPANAKLYDPQEAMRAMEAKLVAVGKDAPNFTLPTPTGGQVALGEALKGKKAVLVNFWFHG